MVRSLEAQSSSPAVSASKDAGTVAVTPRAAIVAAALLAVVLWGGSPIATKLAVADLDPLAVGALRTLIGAVPAAVILAFGRLAFPRTATGRWLLAVSSLSGFVVFPLLFSLALELTSGSHGGLALAILPITTALIATHFERRLPPRRQGLQAGPLPPHFPKDNRRGPRAHRMGREADRL